MNISLLKKCVHTTLDRAGKHENENENMNENMYKKYKKYERSISAAMRNTIGIHYYYARVH